MSLLTIIEEKEKEFDEKFTVWNSKYSWAEKHKIEERYTPQDTKKFFLSALISLLEADIEEMKGMKREKCLKKHDNIAQCIMQNCPPDDKDRVNYNSILSDLISSKQHLLEELKKKV